MKFITYSSTPGLERVPAHERYRAWRTIHNSLVQVDPEYRRHVSRYRTQIVLASVIYCSIFIVPLVVSSIAPRSQMAVFAMWGLATVGFVAYILYTSFGLQEHENERIGRELARRSA